MEIKVLGQIKDVEDSNGNENGQIESATLSRDELVQRAMDIATIQDPIERTTQMGMLYEQLHFFEPDNPEEADKVYERIQTAVLLDILSEKNRRNEENLGSPHRVGGFNHLADQDNHQNGNHKVTSMTISEVELVELNITLAVVDKFIYLDLFQDRELRVSATILSIIAAGYRHRAILLLDEMHRGAMTQGAAENVLAALTMSQYYDLMVQCIFKIIQASQQDQYAGNQNGDQQAESSAAN